MREGNARNLTLIAPYTEGDVKGDIYFSREHPKHQRANANMKMRGFITQLEVR